MGRIRILDENTINQIAAGEVVERPASVVKELVENSIDAGATRIFISLKEGGKAFIQVKDNGVGMTREDALLSIEKHATSKINNIRDLERIRTLGFRGEALSSIASVSQLTMITRAAPKKLEEESLIGTRLVVEGGELKKVEEEGCPAGTTITVENLFFNVPARLKYLKSTRTELNHILQVVSERALSYPEILFEVQHEGRKLLFTPGSGKLLETISALMGRKAAGEMVELSYSGPRAEVRGFVSRPSYSRATQGQMHIFVNRRAVRSPHIIKAIREGYGNLLPPVRYPVAVVELFIDPAELDVNIHPTKSEVKFQYADDVFFSVVNAVKYALSGKDMSHRAALLTDEKSIRKDKVETRYGIENKTLIKEPSLAPETARSMPITGLKKAKQVRIDAHAEKTSLGELARKLEKEERFVDSPLPAMRPLGQVNRLFIIAETKEGFVIIDQHAAHEKVLYERFLREYREEPVKCQRLIEPLSLELAPEEQEAVRAYQSLLAHIGFEIEGFGGNTFIVRTLPVVLGKNATPNTVYDIIDELVAWGKVKSLEERKDAMLKLLACHSAIRGGDELSLPQIEELLEEMYMLKNPFTCPHGRPTIIEVKKKELERRFKRTGF